MPSLVEEVYQQRIAATTPVEKIARMCALNSCSRWNLARVITEELGEMPPEVLKWQMALRLYGRNPDPKCRQLIEEQLERVSHRCALGPPSVHC